MTDETTGPLVKIKSKLIRTLLGVVLLTGTAAVDVGILNGRIYNAVASILGTLFG